MEGRIRDLEGKMKDLNSDNHTLDILTSRKLQFIVESVVKYFDAKFARIWLIDREKKYLML